MLVFLAANWIWFLLGFIVFSGIASTLAFYMSHRSIKIAIPMVLIANSLILLFLIGVVADIVKAFAG